MIPQNAPGHWSTEAGLAIATRYAAKQRADLFMGDMSDLELANGVFLASRTDLDLIAYQTAAKDRIRWLSVQLALAQAAKDEAAADAVENDRELGERIEQVELQFAEISRLREASTKEEDIHAIKAGLLLADTLASDVPITAAARGRLDGAFAALRRIADAAPASAAPPSGCAAGQLADAIQIAKLRAALGEAVDALALCSPSPAVPANFNKKQRAIERGRFLLSEEPTF